MSRPYRKHRRADAEQATRRRIVEAAIALHTSVGPSRTSIGGVAERAGVSRPTVYRHFPDLPSLFAACMGHGMAADPMPDPSAWAEVEDPGTRLQHGLFEIYGYYRRNPTISFHMSRDSETARVLKEKDPTYLESKRPNPEPRVLRLLATMGPMMQARDHVIIETLAAPYDRAGRSTPELIAGLAVAVSFETWSVLTRNGLSDESAAAVAARMVDALA